MNQSAASGSPVSRAIDIALILVLVFVILAWCAQILSPFIPLIIWGGVMATAIYPLYRKLAASLGSRHTAASILIAIIGLAIVIVPLWSFTSSTVETALLLRERVATGNLVVPPPADAVRDWPVIGERVYAIWSEAASNLSAFAQEHSQELRNVAVAVLSRLAGAGLGALQFIASILIAAAFLRFADSASAGVRALFVRLAGTQGDSLMRLSVATIRSIAVGVLGIAAIQALLGGLGMLIVGVPGTGVWALLVLIVAIVQLPPWLILLPVSVYVFSVESTVVAVAFLIWSLVVSLGDMVLKPLLLGRGVEAPMLVILIGALGGMITRGIIGLFLGAVVLGVSFKLMQVWLAAAEPARSVAHDVPSPDAG